MAEAGRQDAVDPDDRKPGLVASVTAVVQRVMTLKPARVFLQYSGNGGPLMASGLAYALLFAVFAGLVVGFAVLGLVIRDDIGLRNSIIDGLAGAVPGLIDGGDGDGVIKPASLLESGAFASLGVVALAGLLFTALNFFASARDAIRRIFGVAPPKTLFILLKLKDLGLAVAFGVAVIVSTALSTASTAALGFVLDLIGVGSESVIGTVLGRVLGLLLVLGLDTVVLAALYRILAGIPIPRRRLFGGALLGAVGLGILKVLGNTLLGGASNNPLFAGFAILIGVLIFFNLICQVILVFASWIAIGMEDSGIAADPAAAEAARIERERIAELERLADEARKPLIPRVLGSIFRRKSSVPADTPADDATGGAEQERVGSSK